jgi:predicted RNA-binding Zn-ribbon protein involved in translation (DUF1610 family)
LKASPQSQGFDIMPEKQNLNTSWIPPEHFNQVDSQVPGVIVYAPKPEEKHIDDAKSYTCPNCGANIAYDVSAGGIACEYCGYVAPVRSINVGKGADEFEFTLETVSQSKRGWGIERQMLHCDSCGGELSLAPGDITSTCPFCASNQVNITRSLEEDLRPRFLIPFKISREQATQLAGEWLGKGWFRPRELNPNAVLRKFNGIYLPFWTFDTTIYAHWKAQVGYEKRVRHYNASQKRWETRTKIEWRWEDGQVEFDVDDLLITGSSSKQVNHQYLEKIKPYQMRDLVVYEPDFLAGWQAQAYQTTLTDAWESAKGIIREQAKKACHRDIPTHHVRNFSMSADFADETWRYILLPVYLATYKFENEPYQLILNGQTGAVAGQKPVAWWKVWLVIAALLAPGMILGFVGVTMTLIGNMGAGAIALGVIAFVIGLIFSVLLYQRISKLEGKR